MFGIPEWALGVGFILLAVSVGRVLAGTLLPADRLRSRRGSRREMAQALEDLQGKVGGVEAIQARLADMDEMEKRLADVEERLDFAERMLAKQRDSDRIVPPKG